MQHVMQREEVGSRLAALILKEEAHVYVCGDGANMIKDVHQALLGILEVHNRVDNGLLTLQFTLTVLLHLLPATREHGSKGSRGNADGPHQAPEVFKRHMVSMKVLVLHRQQ